MKLNFIFGLLFSVVALQMKGAGGTPEGLPPFVRFPGLEQEVYITRDTCKSVEGRFPGFSPFFVIYPDKPCDASEAAALTDELGIASYAHTYSGTVCVMNPLGKEYDAVKDLEAYKNFLNKMRVFTNLKIIGIGKGATFVNRTIAGHAGAVAGIVSLNGRPAKTAEGAAPGSCFYSRNTQSAGSGSLYLAESGGTGAERRRVGLLCQPEGAVTAGCGECKQIHFPERGFCRSLEDFALQELPFQQLRTYLVHGSSIRPIWYV